MISENMFRKEHELICRMDHPNIIKGYPLLEFKNVILMPLKLGKMNLMELIKKRYRRKQGFTEQECSQLMKGILAGISYFHSTTGILHRDLKPENVLIISEKDLSNVRIIDFGMATEVGEVSDFVSCGTWIYQPPEQTHNKFTYGKPVDIWAAGIIMAFILTGKHPFWKPGMTREKYKKFLYDIKDSKEAVLDLKKFNLTPECENLL